MARHAWPSQARAHDGSARSKWCSDGRRPDAARDRAGRWVAEATWLDPIGVVTEDRLALLTAAGDEGRVASVLILYDPSFVGIHAQRAAENQYTASCDVDLKTLFARLPDWAMRLAGVPTRRSIKCRPRRN